MTYGWYGPQTLPDPIETKTKAAPSKPATPAPSAPAETKTWQKALDDWHFSIRRLDAEQRKQIAEAAQALVKANGADCYSQGWIAAMKERQTKAAPAPALVTATPSAPAEVHVHIDKGAIAVQNVMPSDLRVRVDQAPRHIAIERDSNGNVVGANG